jgi:hypothetical protein
VPENNQEKAASPVSVWRRFFIVEHYFTKNQSWQDF